MAKKVTLERAGELVTVALPKQLTDRLGLSAGDEVLLVETESGLLLTPYDATFERALAVYERGAQRFGNALRELSG